MNFSEDPTSYRSVINSSIVVPALIFAPVEGTGLILRALRGYLYSQRGVRNVMDVFVDESNGSFIPRSKESHSTSLSLYKMCLLNPQAAPGFNSDSETSKDISSAIKFVDSDQLKQYLSDELAEIICKKIIEVNLQRAKERDKISSASNNIIKESMGRSPIILNWKFAFSRYRVELNYQNYTMPEILQKLFCSPLMRINLTQAQISSSLVALSGFEQIGHIAHVNLSESHVPFQHVIGQVILDCNPTVDIVVNKVDSITSVFREFKMDIIAYRYAANMMVESMSEETINQILLGTVKQHGCTFLVPYNRVYWNSRLCHEHSRVVDCMNSGDILFDVMAGVGPFAVPAAMKGVNVYANDLNPVGAEYLMVNASLNRTKISAFNIDGRVFMNTVLYKSVMGVAPSYSKEKINPAASPRRHVVMNLPAIAVEFLDVLSPSCPTSPWRYCSSNRRSVDKNVIFHVYCFSAASDVLADAVKQVECHLGYTLRKANIESVVMVRDVAPTKRMVCVSFTLPDSFWENQEQKDEREIVIEEVFPLTYTCEVDKLAGKSKKKSRPCEEPSNNTPQCKIAKCE